MRKISEWLLDKSWTIAIVLIVLLVVSLVIAPINIILSFILSCIITVIGIIFLSIITLFALIDEFKKLKQ